MYKLAYCKDNNICYLFSNLRYSMREDRMGGNILKYLSLNLFALSEGVIAKVIVFFHSCNEIPLGVLAKVALAMIHIIADILTRTHIGFSKILASKCPHIDYQHATAQICINQVSRQCRLHQCYEGRRNISKNILSRLVIFLFDFFCLI